MPVFKRTQALFANNPFNNLSSKHLAFSTRSLSENYHCLIKSNITIMNLTITTLTIILPIVGGIVGYFIKHNIDKKRELLSQVTKERRELYQHFVNLIIEILSGAKSGKKQPDVQLLSKLYEFYKKYVLYASPNVINTFSDYFQYIYFSNDESNAIDHNTYFRKLSRIIKAMRSDLGLSNKELGKDGERIFRALITDFDKIIK